VVASRAASAAVTPQNLSPVALDRPTGESSELSAPRGARPALAPEEVEVLRLLVNGEPNKRIAYLLGVTEGSVKEAVRHIVEEFGAYNRTHAAAIAAYRGLRPDGG
jgi:DNA-binding NarL/FixJ family response regulator